MKISTAMVYLIARLQVTCVLLRRSTGSDKQSDDMLPPSLIPSLALGDRRDRVLAEVDQDGFAFAVEERDAGFFNTRETMNARRYSRIEIILREGAVYLRKSAIRRRRSSLVGRIQEFLRWEFYLEAAALLRLRNLPCVPAIRRIEYRTGAIEMDYIWGRDLGQILANGSREITCDEIERLFYTLLREQGDTWTGVTSIIVAVIRRGVIPRDVHAANFIEGRRSKKLYIVDFGLSHLKPVPGWRPYVDELAWLLERSG